MNNLTTFWQETRTHYLAMLKKKQGELNQFTFETNHLDWFPQVYARLVRAKDVPVPLDMVKLLCDCIEVMSYDWLGTVAFPDGSTLRLSRADVKWFITWFAISIRSCHHLYGDDFVRLVRHFQLTDCYRPQGEFESEHDYQSAWLKGWVRFIELADSYDEPLAAQRIIDRLQRLVSP